LPIRLGVGLDLFGGQLVHLVEDEDDGRARLLGQQFGDVAVFGGGWLGGVHHEQD
jgi:hypothetical protein